KLIHARLGRQVVKNLLNVWKWTVFGHSARDFPPAGQRTAGLNVRPILPHDRVDYHSTCVLIFIEFGKKFEHLLPRRTAPVSSRSVGRAFSALFRAVL